MPPSTRSPPQSVPKRSGRPRRAPAHGPGATASPRWRGAARAARGGGRRFVVGRERLLRDLGFAIPPGLAGQWAQWERAGRTAVLVGWDGQLRGALAVGDTVKPSAPAAVAGLRGLGLRPVLLTGDNEATARAVGA